MKNNSITKILATSLVAATVFGVVGCSSDTEETTVETTTTTTVAESSEETEPETEETEPLPYVNLEGFYVYIDDEGFGEVDTAEATNIRFVNVELSWSDDTDGSELWYSIEKDGEIVYETEQNRGYWVYRMTTGGGDMNPNDNGYIDSGCYVFTLYNRDELLLTFTIDITYDPDTCSPLPIVYQYFEESGSVISMYATSEHVDSIYDAGGAYTAGCSGIYVSTCPAYFNDGETISAVWYKDGQEISTVEEILDFMANNGYAHFDFEMPDGSALEAGLYEIDFTSGIGHYAHIIVRVS